jgi:hypothetical protein
MAMVPGIAQEIDARRGYHHGNLREALIRAALDLIAEKGSAGLTVADPERITSIATRQSGSSSV